MAQLAGLLGGFCGNAVPARLVADAGYDSEKNHELLREYLDIDSLIPPGVGRPTQKLPAGKWRWLMATAFDEETYGQRWQVETVMFMLKRHQGAALTARTHQARRREMGLMCVTHNIMILYEQWGFLQGMNVPFSARKSEPPPGDPAFIVSFLPLISSKNKTIS